MRLYKINLLSFIFIMLFLLIVSVSAETTFFDQDDSFIMGNSATSKVTERTTEVITGGGVGSCVYKWNCTNWNECPQSGEQIRNCTNIGTCSNTYKSPEIKQNCTYTAFPKIDKENKTIEKEAEKQNETKEKKAVLSGQIIAYVGSFILNSIKKGYILFFVMIVLIFTGGIITFRQRNKIKDLIKSLFEKTNTRNKNDNIKGLVNKKVYTNEGKYLGKVNETILEKNRIHSIKIQLDKHQFKTNGIILEYSHVMGVGNIILVDDKVIETIKKKRKL